MPSEFKRAILIIESEGSVRVSELTKFLTALENAYIGSLAFLKMLDVPVSQPSLFKARPFTRRLISRRPPSFFKYWRLFTDTGEVPVASSLVTRREALVAKSVHLDSPGSWKFLGVSDSLEVLRKYLNDRHERRKDKEYREAGEKERLLLENEILRTKAIRERLELVKNLEEVSEEDLLPLFDRFLHQPLEELSGFQDSGLIGDVGLLEEGDEESKTKRKKTPKRKIGE